MSTTNINSVASNATELNASNITREAFMDLKFHEVANILPEMPEGDFRRLKEDILMHGMNEPIIIHQGMILDGRTRYKAFSELLEAGKIKFNKLKLKVQPQVKDPLTYVLSANVRRRHLNESQRALTAVKVSGYLKESASQNQKTGKKVIPGNAVHRNKIAGELINVSPRSVASAVRLIKANNNTIINLVGEGLVRINFALKLARLEPEKFSSLIKRTDELVQDAVLNQLSKEEGVIDKEIKTLEGKKKKDDDSKAKLKNLKAEKDKIQGKIDDCLKGLRHVSDYSKIASKVYDEITCSHSNYAVVLDLKFANGRLIDKYSVVKHNEEQTDLLVIKKFSEKDEAIAYATEMNDRENGDMDEVLKNVREQIQTFIHGLETAA